MTKQFSEILDMHDLQQMVTESTRVQLHREHLLIILSRTMHIKLNILMMIDSMDAENLNYYLLGDIMLILHQHQSHQIGLK